MTMSQTLRERTESISQSQLRLACFWTNVKVMTYVRNHTQSSFGVEKNSLRQTSWKQQLFYFSHVTTCLHHCVILIYKKYNKLKWGVLVLADKTIIYDFLQRISSSEDVRMLTAVQWFLLFPFHSAPLEERWTCVEKKGKRLSLNNTERLGTKLSEIYKYEIKKKQRL